MRQDPASKVGYYRMEIFYGPFLTRAVLPRRVDAARITAEYHDGFLTWSCPRPALFVSR